MNIMNKLTNNIAISNGTSIINLSNVIIKPKIIEIIPVKKYALENKFIYPYLSFTLSGLSNAYLFIFLVLFNRLPRSINKRPINIFSIFSPPFYTSIMTIISNF